MILADTEEEIELVRAGEHFVISEPLEVGTRYFVSVDGGLRLPDPRSMCQPDGPHGPTEVVDPTAFQWTDSDWTGENLHGKIFYEMHGAPSPAKDICPPLSARLFSRPWGRCCSTHADRADARRTPGVMTAYRSSHSVGDLSPGTC